MSRRAATPSNVETRTLRSEAPADRAPSQSIPTQTAPPENAESPPPASGKPPSSARVEPVPEPTTPKLTRVGRYQISGQIGQGGLGTVFSGIDPLLGRPVAIKLPRGRRSQKEAEEFLLEARRLAQLKHPGIVTVFDVGTEAGVCYIVTDLLEGKTLSDYQKGRRLPVDEVVRIVAAIADALAHAHAQGVVHRDIKPRNIFITDDGRPIVLDFGLGVSQETYSKPGQVAGTLTYMSPEQVRGQAHRVDGRTDIFSLGIVLYQMLTGKLPFWAENAVEMIRRIEQDEPQPPRQLVHQITPVLEKICMTALAKDPAKRFTTAGDFAAALRAAVGQAIDPSPLSFASSSSQFLPVTDESGSSTSIRRRTGSTRDAERRHVTVVVMALDAAWPEGDHPTTRNASWS